MDDAPLPTNPNPIHIVQSGKIDENGYPVYDENDCFAKYYDETNMNVKTNFSKKSASHIESAKNCDNNNSSISNSTCDCNINGVSNDDGDSESESNDETSGSSIDGIGSIGSIGSRECDKHFFESDEDSIDSEIDFTSNSDINDSSNSSNNSNNDNNNNTNNNNNKNETRNLNIGNKRKYKHKHKNDKMCWIDGKSGIDNFNVANNSLIYHDLNECQIGDKLLLRRNNCLVFSPKDIITRYSTSTRSLMWQSLYSNSSCRYHGATHYVCDKSDIDIDGEEIAYQVYCFKHDSPSAFKHNLFFNPELYQSDCSRIFDVKNLNRFHIDTLLPDYDSSVHVQVKKRQRIEIWIPLLPDECEMKLISMIECRADFRKINGEWKWIPARQIRIFEFDEKYSILAKEYSGYNNVIRSGKIPFRVSSDQLNSIKDTDDESDDSSSWSTDNDARNRSQGEMLYNWDNPVLRVECGELTKESEFLYKKRIIGEIDIIAELLMKLLSEMNWLVAYEIGEYCAETWQRDVYFDCGHLENMVKSEYIIAMNSSNYNGMNKTAQDIVQNVEYNPVYEQYSKYIHELAIKNQPKFPDSKHISQLYSRHANIPQKQQEIGYLSNGQWELSMVKKRLKIGKNTDTKLYSYQLKTLTWMYSLERCILSKQKFLIGCNDMRFTNDKNIKCNVWYNYNNGKFYPTYDFDSIKTNGDLKDFNDNFNNFNNNNGALVATSEQDHSRLSQIHFIKRYIRFRGGIYSDDVGLGKTLTLLSLILCNPNNGDITCNSTKLFENENEIPQCAPTKNSMSIECDSTLIIAPSHLVKQWNDELNKHFNPFVMKCITITTSAEHRKISYKDILQSQIVIVSSQFFEGTHYPMRNAMYEQEWCDYINPLLTTNVSLANANRIKTHGNRRVTRSVRRSIQMKQDLNKKSPILSLFHWRRVILDEAPDYLQISKTRDMIMEITSQFCWYVSATPFPTRECVAYCADFLDIDIETPEKEKKEKKEEKEQEEENAHITWLSQLDTPMGYILHLMYFNYLFSKNTITSIPDSDNYLPDIKEICHFVDLHPIERLLYNVVKSRRGNKKHENLILERRMCTGLFECFEHPNLISGNQLNNDSDSDSHGSNDIDANINSNTSCYNAMLRKIKKIQQRNNKATDYLWNLTKINQIVYQYKIEPIEKNLSQEQTLLKKLKIVKAELDKIKEKYLKKNPDKPWDIVKAFAGDDNDDNNDNKGKKKRKRKKKTSKVPAKFARLNVRIKHCKIRINNYSKQLKRIKLEATFFDKKNIDKLKKVVNKWDKDFQQEHGKDVFDKILPIIHEYGSKQAHLLTFLKKLLNDNNKSNKIIIFSLFDATLKSIKTRLQLIDISSLLMTGSVHKRKKAMSTFQEKDIDSNGARIVLLSLEHGASGANLTEATHVILCDPVPGSSSEAYACERQAIGRAVRQGMKKTGNENGVCNRITTVVRLVMKNTIEHETHERNEKIRQKKNNQAKAIMNADV